MARGMFWSVAGALSSRVVGLLASIIVARILGKSGFGELGFVQSTTNMYMTFAQFGLGMTVTRTSRSSAKPIPSVPDARLRCPLSSPLRAAAW